MLRRAYTYANTGSSVRGENTHTSLQSTEVTGVNHRKRTLSIEAVDVAVKRLNNGLLGGASGRYCDECDTTFSRPYTYYRHLDVVHGGPPKFACDAEDCGKLFTRADTLDRHKSTQHGNGKRVCNLCGAPVRKDGLRDHVRTGICRKSRVVRIDNHRTNEEAHAVEGLRIQDQETGRIQDSAAEASPPDRMVAMESVDDSTAALQVRDPTETQYDKIGSAGNQQPPLSRYEPDIVLDSPRPKPDAATFNLLMLDNRDESELVRRILQDLTEMNASGVFACKTRRRAAPTSSRFLNPKKPFSRPYKMSLGSQCALCTENLSRDVKSVLKHAQSHVRDRGQRHLTCSACQIKFAFESDLRLHSKSRELWSFCSEINDEDD